MDRKSFGNLEVQIRRDPRSRKLGIQTQRDQDEEPTTVINVIIDSSAVKKSKSVLKKDLKILTIQAPPNMLRNEARKIRLQIRPSKFRCTHSFKDNDLKTHRPSVMGLGDHFIKPDGSIELPITIGKENARKTTMAKFVVLQDSTAYNVILGKKTINDLSGVIDMKFFVMKYETDVGTFETLHGVERQPKHTATTT
ncbi:hypothetical protein PIB30_002463 [Stylosanthes scabra]|uniref:Uncharacterized protein n=1 Tax=Stylosanthes scabra TaxID=79078 RepID=A0ABU6X3X2_9FABA|nr:hypothetical protein [Stylosanthes scabra]